MANEKKAFRFGVNLRMLGSSGSAFHARCRRAEELGFTVLNIPDHLRAAAPFPVAVAAAAATELARIGTHVLNIGFWNPALLAREVATTDQLIDGRLDLGLGGGTVKAEFDEAGLPWEKIGDRLTRLENTLAELERIFADPENPVTPLQRPRPPILIGGNGHRAITVAAKHADIFNFGAIGQVSGEVPGVLRLLTRAECDERLAYFRDRAGARLPEIEVGLLLQETVVTDDRQAEAEKRYAESTYLTPDELLEAPGILLGDVERLADRLHEHRERDGITYFSVHEPSMEEFAKVIDRVS